MSRGRALSSAVQRYAGTLAALLGGIFVGSLLVWAASARDVPVDVVRSFGLLPGLLLFGLGLDWWQARSPRQGLAYLQRASLYWAATFPFARLGQDFLAYSHYRTLDPAADLAQTFPEFAGPGALVGFILFQAVFGAGAGLGFGILARRLVVLTRPGPRAWGRRGG